LDILDEDNYRFRQVPCPFLRPKFCIIYNARPTVCRGYPFVGILDTLLEDGHPQMQSFKCAALENHIADMVVFTLLKVDLTDPLKSKNPLFLKAHAMATRIVMAQQEKKKEYLRLKPRLLSNEGPTVAE
jgi:Fe-S-cluster containining protein